MSIENRIQEIHVEYNKILFNLLLTSYVEKDNIYIADKYEHSSLLVNESRLGLWP